MTAALYSNVINLYLIYPQSIIDFTLSIVKLILNNLIFLLQFD